MWAVSGFWLWTAERTRTDTIGLIPLEWVELELEMELSLRVHNCDDAHEGAVNTMI